MTSWPVIWTRRALALASSQAIARANARDAAIVCAQRRLEREEAERVVDDSTRTRTG